MKPATPPRRILVGIDFSAPSLRACDRALELAEPFRAMLAMVHVVEGGAVLSKVEHEQAHTACTRHLDRIARRMRPYVREVDPIVVDGSPWQRIDEVAKDRSVDLVVTGTHGRRGVTRAVLGSVAERVVRTCSVPVLTVPGWSFVSRSEAGKKLTSALEGLELGSPAFVALSRNAVPIAATMAEALGGTLDLWAVAPLTLTDGTVVGALGENEVAVLDEGAAVSVAQRDDAVARARESVRAEAFALKGTRAVGDLWKRPVVLVADGVFGDAAIRAASEVFARMRPERVVLATPVIARAVAATLERELGGMIWLEKSVAGESVSYRDDIPPGDLVARELLDAVRSR